MLIVKYVLLLDRCYLYFVIDFITKKIIEKKLAIGEQINVLGDGFFIITSHRNGGAAFGILQEQTSIVHYDYAAGCCRNCMVHV